MNTLSFIYRHSSLLSCGVTLLLWSCGSVVPKPGAEPTSASEASPYTSSSVSSLTLSSEPSVEPCTSAQGGGGLLFRYLADQLEGSLRVRERCISDEVAEAQRSVAPKAGRCQGRCGYAELHPEVPLELGAYLALMDLATQGAPLQVRSMKTKYDDLSEMGSASPEINNPNQEVSRELAHMTQVGRQALLFTLATESRCLYQLKTFQSVEREELIYEGLKGLTTRLEVAGVTSTRYHLEQRLTRGHIEVLFLVDIASEGGEEGALLQRQLLCRLPSDAQSLLALSGVALWSEQGQGLQRVGLSAPLKALPPSKVGARLELEEALKGRARLGGPLEAMRGEGARSR